MHFALPPRKSSNPPLYARTSRSSSFRRERLKLGAILAFAALVIVFFAIRLFSTHSTDQIRLGTPEAVIVTLLDPELDKEYVAKIKENRQGYADRHGLL